MHQPAESRDSAVSRAGAPMERERGGDWSRQRRIRARRGTLIIEHMFWFVNTLWVSGCCFDEG
jgi:hypothetical protein